MIRVRAPSRLHFGLLCCTATAGPSDVPARRFGGAGLMLAGPGLSLTVQPAQEWSAEGPLAGRALEFARRFAATLPPDLLAPHHLVVEQCPPEHAGLGTGTQLGMATARALAHAAGLDLDGAELARRVGRGARSGLGVHGFLHGGFLVDGGKGAAEGLAPLLVRLAFPEAWRVLVVVPPEQRGRHGTEEVEAFQRLQGEETNSILTDRLCRLLVLGMLPALVERNLPAFGEALYEFNVLAGQMFAAVQGGTYASAQVEGLVTCLRGCGVRGVGQSSWGPAVFALAGDADQAEHLTHRICKHYALDQQEVFVAAAHNQRSSVEEVQT